ncbi:MAG: hypothetical protein VCF24_24425 [Candidatus Latescibacterota bacterium]|jgi:cell division septal protein FtsQ
MAAETRRKAPRKRKARRKRRRQRRPADRTRLWALVVLAVIIVSGIVTTIAFDDRHWHAFDDAGNVAYERGNYKYAARMYGEALQIAQDLEDARLVAASQQALSRAYAAQERGR